MSAGLASAAHRRFSSNTGCFGQLIKKELIRLGQFGTKALVDDIDQAGKRHILIPVPTSRRSDFCNTSDQFTADTHAPSSTRDNLKNIYQSAAFQAENHKATLLPCMYHEATGMKLHAVRNSVLWQVNLDNLTFM